MRIPAAASIALFCASSALYAGTGTSTNPRQCQSGTLADYLALDGFSNTSQNIANGNASVGNFTTGCSIGFVNFDHFTFFASSGSPDNETQIMVDPATFGFTFSQVSDTPFSGPAHYQIGYDFVIDPAPVLDGADLSLDPGNVNIDQYYCLDGMISQGTNPNGAPTFSCSNTSNRISLFKLHVDAVNPTDQMSFGNGTTGGAAVLTDITIGTGGFFDSITGDASITGSPDAPEPVSSALALLGLGGLLTLKRKMKPSV